MSLASSTALAHRLLEAEGPLSTKRMILKCVAAARASVEQDFAAGKVTDQTVGMADRFYHRRLRYKNRDAPLEARVNGQIKRWKTRPGEFRVPVKYGMYDYFYIDHTNAHEWSTVPNPGKNDPSDTP